MATETYNGSIDANTDWGGDASTDFKPVSGAAVQRFLKQELRKAQDAKVDVDDTLDENSPNPVQNMVVAERLNAMQNAALADSDVELVGDEYRVTLSNSNGDELTHFSIPAATGGSAGDTESKSIKLNVWVDSPTIKLGEKAMVSYTYDTVYLGGDSDGNSTGDDARITVEVIRGSVVAMSFTETKAGSTSPYTVDISSALAAGSNDIKVTAEFYDADANNGEGKTFFKSRTVKLYVSALSLESSFSLDDVVSSGGLTNSVTIPYLITGTGEKNVRLFVNGSQVQTAMVSRASATNGEFVLPLTGYSVGSRLGLDMYADTTINGVVLYSDLIHIDILVGTSNRAWVGLMYTTSYNGSTLAQNASTIPTYNLVQYETKSITYAAYDPASANATVDIIVNGNVAQRTSVARRQYVYRMSFAQHGTHTVNFSVSGSNRILNVNASESPVQVGVATGSMLYDLDASGRSNAESNPAVWTNKRGGTENLATFTGVDWQTSGWTGESLKLINGAKVTLGIQPFKENFNATGLTLEMLVKITNAIDKTSTVINCSQEVGNTSKGIVVTTGEAMYKTGATVDYRDEDGVQQTREIGLKTNFDSDDFMLMSFVFNPEHRTMEIYIDGDRVGADTYSESYDFSLGNAITSPGVTIDSSAADVEIKSVRVYGRGLSDDEEVDNTIAGQSDASKMISLYNANNILGENQDISMRILRGMGKGVLRIVRRNKLDDIFSTNDKSIDFEADVYYEPSDEMKALGAKPFVLYKCFIRIQGTSSTKYPAKNIRIYINKGAYVNGKPLFVVDGVETTSYKYSIRRGTPGQSVVCCKKDFSDSTMSLNTGGAKLFNDMMKDLGLLTPPQQWQKDHEQDITVRSAIDGCPIDIFVAESEDSEYEYVGQYNLNNEKSKSGVLFGMEGVDGFNPECPIALESLNNNTNLCKMKFSTEDGYLIDVDDALDASGKSGFDGSFEFNYPEDVFWHQSNIEKSGQRLANDAERAAVRRLMNFVRDCATNNGTRVPDPNDLATFISQKFKDEADNYFNVDYVLTYYINTDYDMGVDQRVKNMIWRTWDGLIWYITYYDGDTQMGKCNESYLKYPYNISRTTWDVEFGRYAFQGYDSWLWCLFLANMQERIRNCAKAMRKVLTNEKVMDMYEREQMGNWCVRAYNKSGYLSYIKPATQVVYGKIWPFIYACQGRNLPHRRYMVKNRYAVLDAKYGCDAFMTDEVQVSLAQTGAETSTIRVKLSEDYCVGYGTNNTPWEWISDVITGGQSVEMVISGQRDGTDPMRVYGASRYTEFDASDVNGHLSNKLELSKCVNLRVLDLSASEGRTSESFAFIVNGCRQIRRINLNGQVNACTGEIGSKEIDLRTQTRLEWLDCRGVDAHIVQIAEGAPLAEIWTPMSLQTLKLHNLPNLTDSSLHITSWAPVRNMDVQGCPGINVTDLLISWIRNKTTPNDECTVFLGNINWTGVSSELVRALAEMRASFTGTINMGLSTMNAELKQLCLSAWGDIDSDGNPVRIIYNHVSLDTVSITGPSQITATGAYQYRATFNPASANNIKSVRWSGNSMLASINPETGMLDVYGIGTESESPTVTVTVTVVDDENRTYTAQMQVRLYNRRCAVGDLLYADGSTSPVSERDMTKSVVGVCFYVNPDNPMQRLAVAKEYMMVNGDKNIAWGLANIGTQFSPGGIQNLTLSTGESAYDVDGLTNWPITESITLNESNIESLTSYNSGSALSECGFSRSGVPYGKSNTESVIAHRNKVVGDPNINDARLRIPTATPSKSEFDDLMSILVNIWTGGGNYAERYTLKTYMYPAASLCYAYEPGVMQGEHLADCLKANNWFLPAIGDLAWLCYRYNNDESMQSASSFLPVLGSQNVWSSTETSVVTKSIYVYFGNSQVQINLYKSDNVVVVPIVAF